MILPEKGPVKCVIYQTLEGKGLKIENLRLARKTADMVQRSGVICIS